MINHNNLDHKIQNQLRMNKFFKKMNNLKFWEQLKKRNQQPIFYKKQLL